MAVSIGAQDVSYTIGAVDATSSAFNSVDRGLKGLGNSAEQLQQRMALSMEKMRQNWMGIAASAAALGIAAKQAWDMAGTAADYQERVDSLNSLGAQYNMTGNQIVRSMQEASRGLLSMSDAANMAASSLNLSLSPKQMIEFTRVSEQLTDVVGGTIPEAFSRMTTAAATGRTMTLAQMGIIVDLDAAYKKHGESLSEAQKQQIRLNVILDAAKAKTEALGPPTDSTRDKMDRMIVTVKDLQLQMGQVLIRAAAGTVGAFYSINAASMVVSSGIWSVIEVYRNLRAMLSWGSVKAAHEEAARYAKEQAGADANAAGQYWQKAKDNFEAMTASADELGKSLKAAVPPMKEALELTDKQKKLLLQSIEDRVRAAEEEQKEWAKYYTEEGERLNKHYQSWNDHLKWIAENRYNNLKRDTEQRIAGEEAVAARIKAINEATLISEQFHLETRLQQQADFWASIMDTVNQSGDLAQGMGMFATGVKGIMEAGGENDPYEQQVQRALDHYQTMKEMYWWDFENRKEVADAWGAYIVAAENADANRRLTIAANTFQGLSGLALAFYQLSKNQNETWFKVYQGLQIGMAIINTYKAASAAWQAGWDAGVTPYDKPAVAAAYMAVAIATGLAQVAAIASATPTGGGTTSTGAPSSSGYTYTSPTTPSWQEEKPASREPMGVVIQIYGDVLNSHDDLARKLVEPIRKAINDGER